MLNQLKKKYSIKKDCFNMKVALVHDYLREYGGAERVLKTLTEMYPDAPIYTAFTVKNSTAVKLFQGRKIYQSWLAPLLKFGKLYSPLRFLAPFIWKSFDLSGYDLIITSCSWYITRGFKFGNDTKVVAYCHTPPRWLYGYETSVGFKKYWPVKIYSAIVGHFLRMYDWDKSQEIDHWIANSENVRERIQKFYRKSSVVIYPPVDVEKIIKTSNMNIDTSQKNGYFLIVSRLVGAKGIENAIEAFRSKQLSKYKLKIVGETAGYKVIDNKPTDNVEFLGRVDDKKLWEMYAGATGFIALAKDEDFGMTVVEAQAAGCPVLAYRGGGFRETVIEGQTGIFVDASDKKTIVEAVERFVKMKWNKKLIVRNAGKFSKDRFINSINGYVNDLMKGKEQVRPKEAVNNQYA